MVAFLRPAVPSGGGGGWGGPAATPVGEWPSAEASASVAEGYLDDLADAPDLDEDDDGQE
ncbi:hypothetical protein GCM10009864_80760 [Streptomyces lunalinharesii]|uniref:Uncharacterized protein n=1 Tax=Streptomyces lunalinharesii TaxID=333384 RepID=A0ABN3T5G4_9ACTN